MRIYAHLLVALAGRDVDQIAAGAGVAPDAIRAAAELGKVLDVRDQERLATHLGIPRDALFREWGLIAEQMVDLEPHYPEDRYVTATDAIRTIDRPRR